MKGTIPEREAQKDKDPVSSSLMKEVQFSQWRFISVKLCFSPLSCMAAHKRSSQCVWQRLRNGKWPVCLEKSASLQSKCEINWSNIVLMLFCFSDTSTQEEFDFQSACRQTGSSHSHTHTRRIRNVLSSSSVPAASHWGKTNIIEYTGSSPDQPKSGFVSGCYSLWFSTLKCIHSFNMSLLANGKIFSYLLYLHFYFPV